MEFKRCLLTWKALKSTYYLTLKTLSQTAKCNWKREVSKDIRELEWYLLTYISILKYSSSWYFLFFAYLVLQIPFRCLLLWKNYQNIIFFMQFAYIKIQLISLIVTVPCIVPYKPMDLLFKRHWLAVHIICIY